MGAERRALAGTGRISVAKFPKYPTRCAENEETAELAESLLTQRILKIKFDLRQGPLRNEVVKDDGNNSLWRIGLVGSSGACNSYLQYSRRRLKPQRLPWTLVQA